VTPENGFDSPASFACSGLLLDGMFFRPGDGDPLGRSGNDPTHHLGQCAMFCLPAEIPTILPVHHAGCGGLLLRVEKSGVAGIIGRYWR
jgi:hypothetical protein